MDSPLFRHYPSLVGRLPHVPILTGPTPVERLTALEARLGVGPIWVKRDDLTARPYGGNKPRKLEFLLGAARDRGSRSLVTFGGLGSNHALATAVHGRQHGFAVTTILVPQPVDDHVRQNLLALHSQGARLVYAPTTGAAALAAARVWLTFLLRDYRRPYLIPPGGSSPTGTLGYVGAALELADQVGRGELPAPEAIFVAGGSNGTAAGLLAGLRLAGLTARLVAIRVSDRLVIHPRVIARLATATVGLLRRLAHVGEPAPVFRSTDLEVWDEYLGPGYGHPTSEGDRAVQLLAETAGLVLDRTYTGKTMAALLDVIERPAWRSRTLLYWHTANGQPLAPLVAADAGSKSLPAPFAELLRLR